MNIPPTVSTTGKRERCYFATRDEAKTYAQEQGKKYREHGSQAASIRPALAEDATKAAEILKPFGVDFVAMLDSVEVIEDSDPK